MPDDDVDAIDSEENQTDDLGSIQDFAGKTIDEPGTPHVQEKPDRKPKAKEKEKEEIPPKTDEDEGEEELDDFEQQYDDISKVWTRPTVTSIRGKYPDIFKNFPELRTVMFREGKFTEMFPTLEEAADASIAKEDLDEIMRRINAGEVEEMLGDLDKTVVPKVANNFLPALYKTNQELYYKILNPIFDNVLKAAYKQGETAGDDNLKWSAAHLSKFIFGDESFASGEKTVPRLDFKEDKALADERAKFQMEKFTEAREAVVNHSVKRMEAEIKSGLPQDISPRLQSIIVDQVVNKIDATLNKDEQHLTFMKRLWSQAAKGNFSGEHKARISSAYLARARNMIPKFRETILAELVGEETEGQTNGSRRKLSPGGGPPSGSPRQRVTKENIVYEKSGDLDIIKGNATLKNR